MAITVEQAKAELEKSKKALAEIDAIVQRELDAGVDGRALCAALGEVAAGIIGHNLDTPLEVALFVAQWAQTIIDRALLHRRGECGGTEGTVH